MTTINLDGDVALASTSATAAEALALLVWGLADETSPDGLRRVPPGALDLVSTATNRRPLAFVRPEGEPDFWRDLLAVFAEALAPIERALWKIGENRSAATATGDLLDRVARMVDRNRNGVPDELLRVAVMLDGRGFGGGGATRPELVEAAGLLWGDRHVYSAEVAELPATFRLGAIELSDAEARLAADLLGELRAGGVRLAVEVWPAWVYGVAFDGAPDLLAGWVSYAEDPEPDFPAGVGWGFVA